MRNGLLFTLIALILLPSARVAAQQRDGATIRNSGSTNTVGYTITLWTDGTGSASVQGGAARTIAIAHDLVTQFFSDLQAAHVEHGQLAHCMKSVSFGTTTTVVWHAWQSPDLQCPPFSANVAALAKDVQAIEAAAGVNTGTPRRIGIPPYMRKNPPATPEVQPT
jgi:hypothetical protein